MFIANVIIILVIITMNILLLLFFVILTKNVFGAKNHYNYNNVNYFFLPFSVY